jgi:hypothetical protein
MDREELLMLVGATLIGVGVLGAVVYFFLR